MKISVTICLLLFLAVFEGNAQITPESFISRIPPLPNNACTMSGKERDEYDSKISDLSDLIKNEISKRQAALDETMSGNSEIMTQNMVQGMGLSASDMAKMKQGENMSEADAMAMANKMMNNKYNMSVDEAKNLEKMSNQGKQAWGEAYGSEITANAQANPEKQKAEQSKNQNMFKLVQEKKLLADKHMAMSSKFQQQFQELENDTSESRTLKNIGKWTEEWYSMTGVDHGQGPKMDALAQKIKTAKISYCNKLTPRYFDIYQRYLDYLKTNLPDFYRMEELEYKIMTLQSKANNKQAEPGLMALQLVSEYINKLNEVFKYSLYSPDSNF